MPFFLSEKTYNNVVMYFTLLSLYKQSVKKTRLLYQEMKNKKDWEDLLVENSLWKKSDITKAKNLIETNLEKLNSFDLVVERGEHLYPKLLVEVETAPEFLFMRGDALLLEKPIISIVGSRNASDEGKERATKLAYHLTNRDIIIASGLARGIDKAAHRGAYLANKKTIAVIGTPLNKVYPKEHEELQEIIGKEGLVISQFAPGLPVQRFNFPARNATMSGISIATIVIEAGETSGSLIQAREALKQGRKVFIPQSALDNPKLKWPKQFVEKKGASKFVNLEDLLNQLQREKLINQENEKTSCKTVSRTLGG